MPCTLRGIPEASIPVLLSVLDNIALIVHPCCCDLQPLFLEQLCESASEAESHLPSHKEDARYECPAGGMQLCVSCDGRQLGSCDMSSAC